MNATGKHEAASEVRGISPGDVLVGKFRVERIVGRGGMGVVVEATNMQLDQRVALKLLASGADDPVIVERFAHEARAAARLRSEHVARVYDVGRDPVRGPFIVMELLEGQTLAEVLSTSGPVPLHRAVEYVIDACEGLAEAHARGIVHQDVKPGNLFLVTGSDGRPCIKLLDFGIAMMRSKDQEGAAVDSRSGPRSGLGTPAYLAPEQLRCAPVDHRADIWALGCVLYELLVGERAFRAKRFTELVTQILEVPPHPIPAELDVPVPIANAIERCLQKDPAKRFTSTAALALALLPFARRRAHAKVARAVGHAKTGGIDPHLQMPSSMPPPPSSEPEIPSSALRPPRVPSFVEVTAPTEPAPALAAATPAPPAEQRSQSKKPVVLFAIAGLLLAAAGVAFVLSRPERTAAMPAPSPGPEASAAAASEPAPEPPRPVEKAASAGATAEATSESAASSASAEPAGASASAHTAKPVVAKPRAPKPRTTVGPSSSAHALPPPAPDDDIRRSR